jgi:transketolase
MVKPAIGVPNTVDWRPGDKVAIRDGYGKGLLALGEEHEEVVALDADLADSTRSAWFGKKFPQRFFQMGISEQDMVVTAAGLAHMGKVPFVSTFAIFLQRGWEQIRNCVARQQLNVNFCGSHGGLMTGQDGSSAHALEDVGIYRGLPGFRVVVPGDAVEAALAVPAMYAYDGPTYMRSTRAAVPVVFAAEHEFEWGKGQVLRDGEDAAILCNGPQVAESLKAAEQAHKDGISVRVVNLASVKPIDRDLVLRAARDTGHIITAEDHFIHNGLGSAVAEVLAEAGAAARLQRIGVQDTFTTSGTPEELYRLYGVDAAGIRAAVQLLRA